MGHTAQDSAHASAAPDARDTIPFSAWDGAPPLVLAAPAAVRALIWQALGLIALLLLCALTGCAGMPINLGTGTQTITQIYVSGVDRGEVIAAVADLAGELRPGLGDDESGELGTLLEEAASPQDLSDAELAALLEALLAAEADIATDAQP